MLGELGANRPDACRALRRCRARRQRDPGNDQAAAASNCLNVTRWPKSASVMTQSPESSVTRIGRRRIFGDPVVRNKGSADDVARRQLRDQQTATACRRYIARCRPTQLRCHLGLGIASPIDTPRLGHRRGDRPTPGTPCRRRPIDDHLYIQVPAVKHSTRTDTLDQISDHLSLKRRVLSIPEATNGL